MWVDSTAAREEAMARPDSTAAREEAMARPEQTLAAIARLEEAMAMAEEAMAMAEEAMAPVVGKEASMAAMRCPGCRRCSVCTA